MKNILGKSLVLTLSAVAISFLTPTILMADKPDTVIKPPKPDKPSKAGKWGKAKLVETDSGDARFPQIAMDVNGNGMTVWQQDDGTSINILANRYVTGKGKGTGWGTAESIESDSVNAYYPQIAMDPNGNAVSVWQQNDNILANSYVVNAEWGTEEVIENNENWAHSPQVAMDASGNAMTVWHQEVRSDDHIQQVIWANSYVVGSGWSTVESLRPFGPYSFPGVPQVAMSANGDSVAVWNNYDEGTSGIEYNHYEADIGWYGIGGGSPSGADWRPSGSHQIAMDDNGNGIVVWTVIDEGNSRIIILANRYVDDIGWGTYEIIGNGSNAQIAMNDNGNAIAVWVADDGTSSNIMANRYVVGSGWDTQEIIGNGSNAQIAMDNNGNAIAVWVADDGININIMANRYVVDTGWGTAESIETGSGEANSPQITMDNNGNAIAVWYQYDGTYYSIFANHFK